MKVAQVQTTNVVIPTYMVETPFGYNYIVYQGNSSKRFGSKKSGRQITWAMINDQKIPPEEAKNIMSWIERCKLPNYEADVSTAARAAILSESSCLDIPLGLPN